MSRRKSRNRAVVGMPHTPPPRSWADAWSTGQVPWTLRTPAIYLFFAVNFCGWMSFLRSFANMLIPDLKTNSSSINFAIQGDLRAVLKLRNCSCLTLWRAQSPSAVTVSGYVIMYCVIMAGGAELCRMFVLCDIFVLECCWCVFFTCLPSCVWNAMPLQYVSGV